MNLRLATLAAAAAALSASAPQEKDPPIAVETVKLGRAADFKVDVLPILKANCLACHNAKDAEADLVLESPAGMLKGGEKGPALVPGKGEESLLVKLPARMKKPHMPPKDNKVGAKSLTPRELGILKVWIDEGAKGTGGGAQLDPPKWLPTPANWNPIYAVALDAEGQLAACGRAGRLSVYHLPTGKLLAQPSDPKLGELVTPGQPGLAHPDAVHSMSFSPDGSLLATGGYRAIKLWRKTQSEQKLPLGSEVKVAALSADGSKLAFAASDPVIRIFDLATGQPAGEARGHAEPVSSLRFSPDGALLASGSADKTVRVWKADGSAAGAIEAGAAVTAVEWAGKAVAAAGADNVVRVWTYPAEEKPAAPKEVKVPTGPVVALRSTAQGLLSASADGKAVLWNLENSQKVREVSHGAPVTGLEVSPDGKRWVTLSAAGAKLWNGESGQAVAELKTDGPARRRDQQAAAVLAFATSEIAYRQGRVKAAEDAKKKEEEEVKKAADAVPPLEKDVKDKEAAFAKAKGDREALDRALADSAAALEAAKARLDAATKGLAVTDPDEALKQAEAENAAALQALADPAKAAQARARVEASGQMLQVARAALALRKAEAEKAAAEQAAKAADEAVKVAPDDKKAKAADEAAAAAKARDAAAAALQQAKSGLDPAKKGLEAARAAAEQAAKAAEAQQKDAQAKHPNAKKAEEAAAAAFEQSKLNLESGGRRVEKAKEAVARDDQKIKEAGARLEDQKKDQARLDGQRKQAAEALAKAAGPLVSAGFSHDGALIALGGEDGTLYAFGAEKGDESAPAAAHRKGVVAAGFAPDGRVVSVGSDGSARRAAPLPGWRLERVIEGAESGQPPIDRVLALAFSPDGKLLASGGGTASREGELLLWNPADGKLVREFASAHSDSVYSVSFSPDGTLLATTGADKFAKVFDVATGKVQRSFEGHTHHVLGVGWNRTGRTIATAGADDVVKVWDAASGQQVKTVQGFAKQATSIRYLGYEDKFIVTAGGAPVRLVQESGQVLRNFDSGGAFMYAASLSGDGRVVAAGGLDGVLRLWRVDNGQPAGSFKP